MFQKNIYELLNEMPNVFSIADDILITGSHELGKDHGATLDKVLGICRKTNLKLNKDMCLFSASASHSSVH